MSDTQKTYSTISACVALCLVAASAAFGQVEAAAPVGTPWPATDALARRLPLSEEVGPPQRGRFVGIFYFLWHNQGGNAKSAEEGPHDISKILSRDPDALKKPASPLWGPVGSYHYWGEPLYGYYLSTDPWVLRRHANLLADAGVDVLIFDATNAAIYAPEYHKLCEVLEQIRSEGDIVPQIAFMVNTQAGQTAEAIYKDLYQPGLFRDLWFKWEGKPLMLCDPSAANAELKQFFTLRKAHWPFEMINTPYAWHWEAAYPQPFGYKEDLKKPEQVNVSVAQNLRVSDGRVTNMSNGDARGRGFHNGKGDSSRDAIDRGDNFQEQWSRAFDLKPPFVLVTGWNEWIAGRWSNPDGSIMFVDQYDAEFSRDVEMVKGLHCDNYYYQLVGNVRRYKGAPALPRASAPVSIDVSGSFDQWKDVAPEFRDHIGETLPRDFNGAVGLHYTNKTGRNDIVACKVARDAHQLYFSVRCRQPLTPRTGKNWMWLLIDIDGNAANGWQGYDFIVNRTTESDSQTSLERNEGGWQWKKVDAIRYRASGNQLQLAVPYALLGLTEGTTAVSINFKWVDNLQQPGDIMDFYTSGDVAPEGRYLYRYVAK